MHRPFRRWGYPFILPTVIHCLLYGLFDCYSILTDATRRLRRTIITIVPTIPRQGMVLRGRVSEPNLLPLLANRSSGEGDKCYVDQESVCEEDSSVACTRLAKGTSDACCPKLTTCDPDSDAAEDSVRCIINWTDLVVADAAQKSKDAQSQTTTSATSSSTSTTTTTTTSAVSTTSSESNESKESEKPPAEEDKSGSGGVSGGVIAGAVVGSLAGVVLGGALVFFLLRRRREAKYEAANQVQPTSPRLSSEMTTNVVTFPPKILTPQDPGYVYAPPPSELDGSYTFAELDSTREPQQLDSTSVIAQLDSTAPQRDLMSPLRETSSPQLDVTSQQRELGPNYMDSASHQRDWSVSQLSSASPQRDSSTSQLGPTNIPRESTISQLEPTTTPQQQTPKP